MSNPDLRDRNVLEIMSWSFPGHEKDEDGGGGGYKLLRSEYRADMRPPLESARAYVHAIWQVLAGDFRGAKQTHIAVHDLYLNGDVVEEDLRLFATVLSRYIRLLDPVPAKTAYEFRVTLEVAGDQPDELEDLLAREMDSALAAHFADTLMGENEEYDVTAWYVDKQDPELSVNYDDDDPGAYERWKHGQE